MSNDRRVSDLVFPKNLVQRSTVSELKDLVHVNRFMRVKKLTVEEYIAEFNRLNHLKD